VSDNNELTALILDAAAQEICDQGFIKGAFFDEQEEHEHGLSCKGPSCALGAIWRARFLLDENNEYTGSIFEDPAANALASILPITPEEFVPTWNDKVERTSQEVSDAMFEAAAQLRTGGPRKR
jgi:hypothetical protein